MKRSLLVTLSLVMLTGAVFLRVGTCEFVNYDDPDYVTSNRYVQMGLTWESIRWAFVNLHGVRTYWHPLTWLSHMLDVQIFGLNARAHHLVNLLFHTGNVLLLFVLLRRLTGSLYRSALVAALFAIHPLQVDTVAWVTERKNLLAGLFCFVTLLAYRQYALRPGTWRYLLTVALFVMGLMCKPVLVMLPFMMLLLDFWPLGRLRPFSSPDALPAAPPASILRLFREKIPFLTLAAVSSLITVSAHRQIGIFQHTEGLSVSARAANAVVSYARYLRSALFPYDLAVLYPHPGGWNPVVVLLCAALAGAVTIVVLRRMRESPYLLVGWFWFLGLLLPTIGLIQAGIQSMADRFMYLPSVGLWLAAVWGGAELTARWPRRCFIRGAVASLALAVFSVLSWIQIGYWKNNIALWSHTVSVTRSNYLAHYNLASALYDRGNLDGAMTHALEALKIKPDYADARCQVANVLYDRGRTNEAIANYFETERLNPGWAAIPFHVAKIFSRQKDFSRAIAQYRIALAISPDWPVALKPQERIAALNNLAWILSTNPDAALRNGREAVQLAEEACRLTEYSVPVLLGTLAAAYAERSAFDLAATTAQQARDLALARNDKPLAVKNEALLALYKSGKPFREE